ncbi:MAG TPA: hydroxymethylglutaryl-CoA synthase, partial [archaeon]|nr:hydroxymethylglutaryl-CoA synthase [archaeon]
MQYGIVGYGSYIPRLRIKVEEIAKVWGDNAQAIKDGLGVSEKSVPELDEDTITISVESARNAIMCAEAVDKNFNPEHIDGVYVGSESHPYAVKPSGATVAEAIGATPNVSVVDTEFACRAGTSSIQICLGLAKSGQARYALAIGADTSQGKPGDALEYTAAAGGAAFIIGPDPIATIDAWHSFVTDTPDFWRREVQKYPSHGGR